MFGSNESNFIIILRVRFLYKSAFLAPKSFAKDKTQLEKVSQLSFVRKKCAKNVDENDGCRIFSRFNCPGRSNYIWYFLYL